MSGTGIGIDLSGKKVPGPPPTPSDLQAPDAADPKATPTAAPPAKSGGGKGALYVVLVLLLLAGAGAAAYFGNLIPR